MPWAVVSDQTLQASHPLMLWGNTRGSSQALPYVASGDKFPDIRHYGAVRLQ